MRLSILVLLLGVFMFANSGLAVNDLDKHPKTKKNIVKKLENNGVADAHAIMSDERLKLYPEIFRRSKVVTNNGLGIIISPESIQRGRQFMEDNWELFDAVEQRYSVPKEIIVAIMRVETNFGGFLGKHETINAILTQIVHGRWYRKSMFEKELLAWLNICQSSGVDPYNLKGSTCGAFGFVQFLPSSYLRWAVDHDGDGFADLYSIPDAVASCANYLVSHGWKRSNWGALMAYNHDKAYTRLVMNYAKAVKKAKLVIKPKPELEPSSEPSPEPVREYVNEDGNAVYTNITPGHQEN